MEDVPQRSAQPQAKARPRPRASVLTLLVLVAACASIFWAVRSFDAVDPVRRWTGQLRRGDADQREVATTQLAQVDPEAVPVALPALLAALADDEPRVRVAAASAIGRLASNAAPSTSPGLLDDFGAAAPHLVERLADPRAEARLALSDALAAIGDLDRRRSGPPSPTPFSLDALARAADDPDAQARGAILSALAAWWRRSGVVPEPIRRAATDPDPTVRAGAARALGRLVVGPASVRLLVRLAGDDDRPARSEAITALEHHARSSSEAYAALWQLWLADGAGLASFAGQALDRVGPPPAGALPMLIDAVRRDGPDASRAALRIGQMKPTAAQAVPTLLDALRPELSDPGQVAAARELIGAIGLTAPGSEHEVAALRLLLDLLARAPAEQTPFLANALGRFGPKARKALPALLADAEEPPTSRPMFSWELRALAQIARGTPDQDRAVAALIRLVERAESQTCGDAATALADLGADAAPALPVIRRREALVQPSDRKALQMARDRIERAVAVKATADGRAD